MPDQQQQHAQHHQKPERAAPKPEVLALGEQPTQQARIADLEAQLAAAREKRPAPPPENTDDLGTGRTYASDDRVIVLHGWGRVPATVRDYKFGKSKVMYKGEGGLVRDVLYGDAVYWRQQWGAKYVKILPLDATEADFARATGIQPMDLSRLAAMNEAVDLAALVEAWGPERSLRFAERLTRLVASQSPARGHSSAPTIVEEPRDR